MPITNKENPIPIEAAFKYLVKENKEYKRKLDMLVPYTKKLEQKVQELEKNIDLSKDENIKKLVARIDKLEKENKRLIEENTHLIFDYHKTEWFKGMQKHQQKRQETIKNLRIALNRAMVKLSKYE